MDYEMKHLTYVHFSAHRPLLQSQKDSKLSSRVEINGEMGFLISKQAQGALME